MAFPGTCTRRRKSMAEGSVQPHGAGADRVGVRKTYKLFIGGAFPRSESGRSYVVASPSGVELANAAQASRKDAREAVVAARAALAGWSRATAFNRGQILYRVAEMLEGRRSQFSAEVARSEGTSEAGADEVVSAVVDRWVWYAGLSDKLAQVVGSTNPVAGPYFNFSLPEPTGVVAVVAPQESSLLGLCEVLAATIVSGNTAVVLASQTRPLPAMTLAEVLATSDLPSGVVNVLSGLTAELAPVLASHMDVNAIDLVGVEPAEAAQLARMAADNVKRVLAPPAAQPDWWKPPSLARVTSLIEIKTVWHPMGT